MALGTAEDGGEPGDALRVLQRGDGRTQFLRENDGTDRYRRVCDIRLLAQISDEARTDDPDVLDPCREIGIAHGGEAFRDLIDLDLHSTFGIDARSHDAL